MHERRIVTRQATRRVLPPPRVEREPVDRLTIRAAREPLQHHHHRHDHRRHTVTPRLGEQVSEHLIREQPEALAMQQPVDRVRRHPALAEAGRRREHIRLRGSQSKAHTLKHDLRVGRSEPLQLRGSVRAHTRAWAARVGVSEVDVPVEAGVPLAVPLLHVALLSLAVTVWAAASGWGRRCVLLRAPAALPPRRHRGNRCARLPTTLPPG